MRKIKRTICTEEMVSRIPSLFAYCEFDEFGVLKEHKATDSIDGSYGHLMCGVKSPYALTIEDLNGNIANEGECISYRTLMNYYWHAKQQGFKKNNHNTIIKFVETAIGLIEIELIDVIIEVEGGNCVKKQYKYSEDKKFTFDIEPTKLEKTMYLSQAKKQYNEMVKLKKLCQEYKREVEETPDVRETFETKNVCCVCDDYWERGGDTMVDILAFFIELAEEIANEYYEYRCLDKTSFNVSFDLNNTYNDPGYYTPYLLNWKPGQVIHSKEKFIYENEEGVMTMYQNESDEDYYGHYDEENERVVFDPAEVTELKPELDRSYSVENIITIRQKSDSKLQSLRRYTKYTDPYGVEQKPDEDEDWLYLYTKGMIRNLRTKNDEFGNIGFYENTNPHEGDTVLSLMAYGDVVTNITYDTEERKIIFQYVTGAHLKAKIKKIEVDDDNNKLYFYDEFEIDNSSIYSENCGIYYTEEYTYEQDGAIEKLINNEFSFTFEEYVNDRTATDGIPIKRFCDEVFPFYTGNQRLFYDKQIDTKKTEINYLNSDLTYKKTFGLDMFEADIFKEDYLMGIHFKPNVEDDVNIDRGKNAAFERHIKLGEVKTLQDMENYQNGGFFNIKEY